MARLPWLQFYPNDWLADPAVRSCSVAARGLWMDMLSLMHLSARRGYLLAATGTPLTPEQLARLTGCSAEEVSRLLAELRTSGVFSCTDDGVIFSRRMVRDESKREKCADAGRKGGGNPTFGGGPKGAPKGGGKGTPKPPEARSQRPEEDPPKPPAEEPAPIPLGNLGLDTTAFREAWANWIRDKPGSKLRPPAQARQLAKLAEIGPDAAVRCIEHSLMNQYQGLFPEKFAAPKPAARGGLFDFGAKTEARILAQVAESLIPNPEG